MPTIHDVASRAGVSPITVSRVINRSGYVKTETRQRVEAAIAELRYVPNRLARSLRIKKTSTVALVLTDITNPFWTAVARSVDDAARDAGFSVVICNTDGSPIRQGQALDTLIQKQVDGILLVPAGSDSEPVEWIQEQGIPVVVLDRQVLHRWVDAVRCDSEGGAYQLVQHLVSLGHRRIAVLGGPPEVSTAADRVAGYCRALREAGLEPRAEWIYHSPFSTSAGFDMAQRVLSIVPRPTALFATNNLIAVGALRALRDAGLRVPEDMSVVVFDDLTSELVIEPFFTAVDQPAYEMGRVAAELLLARLSGSATGGYQEILLPTKMIVRRSSAPPPG